MTAPRRRWFQFSLRTLFVGVTLLACWLGDSLNWIRERHAFIRTSKVAVNRFSPSVEAPYSLRLFGEMGWNELGIISTSDAERAMRLFPEVKIVAVPRTQ